MISCEVTQSMYVCSHCIVFTVERVLNTLGVFKPIVISVCVLRENTILDY